MICQELVIKLQITSFVIVSCNLSLFSSFANWFLIILIKYIYRGIQQISVVKTQSLKFGYKLWSNRLSYVMVNVIHAYCVDAGKCCIQALVTEILSKYFAALNETLKKEVERLKVATGEMMSPVESFNLGMHQMPYNQSGYFPLPQQGPISHHNMQLPPFNHSQASVSAHHLHQSNPHHHSDILQNDPVGRLQGLDISSKGPPIVKSEGPSLSASESSTTF